MEQLTKISVGPEDGDLLKDIITAVTGKAHKKGSKHFYRSRRSVYMEPGARRPWNYCWQEPALSMLDEVLNKLDFQGIWFEAFHNGTMLANRLRWEACRNSYKHIEEDGTRRMLPMDTQGDVQLTEVKIIGQ